MTSEVLISDISGLLSTASITCFVASFMCRFHRNILSWVMVLIKGYMNVSVVPFVAFT